MQRYPFEFGLIKRLRGHELRSGHYFLMLLLGPPLELEAPLFFERRSELLLSVLFLSELFLSEVLRLALSISSLFNTRGKSRRSSAASANMDAN